MKVIDLLNKMANDYKYRPTVKYMSIVYKYNNAIGDYKNDFNDDYGICSGYCINLILDDEVEVIEENTIDEIEELDYKGKTIFSIKPNDYDTRCGIVNVDIFLEMKDKLNELVQAVNKINKKIREEK